MRCTAGTPRRSRRLHTGFVSFSAARDTNSSMPDIPRAWMFLGISALFEVGWIVSLKLMDGFGRLLPLAGYAVTGLGAAVFLSFALKAIPMGTAYAVWMGGSLVGALIADRAIFREPWSPFRAACALIIVIGACGLRLGSSR